MRANSFIGILLLLNANLVAQTQLQPLLVVVVEGSGITNSLSAGRGGDVVVEVQDQRKNPVAQATVTAYLPASGVGGEFSGDHTIATERTDALGRASFRGIHLRPLSGQFPIRITAAFEGMTGSATATQTNANLVPKAEGRFPKRYMIMAAIVAAGAAVGIVVGTHNASNGSNPSGFAVSPGNPVVAGPR